MNDTTIILPATDAAVNTSAQARRGRKPETPAQRLERLQRQVMEAKQAAEQAHQRKCAIVGEALLAEAEADNTLSARIIDTLRRRVTTARAKADIASLLAE